MLDFLGRWLGLFAVVAGVCVLLALRGFTLWQSEPLESRLSRYGKPLTVGGVLAIVVGTLQLAGIFPGGNQPVPPAVSPTGSVQMLPPGMTLHRHLAGNRDEDGWFTAVSTRGRFTVRLPLPFDDFTLEREFGSSGKIVSHGIGATSPEHLSFTVMEEVRSPSSPPASLADFVAESGQFVLGEPRKFTLNGFQGVEFQTTNAPTEKYARYLRIGDCSITMTLEFPPQQAAQAAEVAEQFLNSLSLSGISP